MPVAELLVVVRLDQHQVQRPPAHRARELPLEHHHGMPAVGQVRQRVRQLELVQPVLRAVQQLGQPAHAHRRAEEDQQDPEDETPILHVATHCRRGELDRDQRDHAPGQRRGHRAPAAIVREEERRRDRQQPEQDLEPGGALRREHRGHEGAHQRREREGDDSHRCVREWLPHHLHLSG